MKYLAHLLGFLLVAPTAVFADNSISGIWGGFGIQDNGSAWTIKMSMRDSSYKIDYPSIPCGGYLKLLSRSGNKYTFKEKITKHKKNCIDNGKLVVTIADENTLNWKWYYPSGKTGSSTKVKKYSSLQEFESKVPPLLAEYRKEQKKYSNNDAEVLGAALGAAAVLGGLYWLFSGDDASDIYSSSSYSPSYGATTNEENSKAIRKKEEKGISNIYKDGNFTIIVCNDGRKRKVHHDPYGKCTIPSAFGSYSCSWAIKDTKRSCY